jgi:hypothetical protein
VERTTIRKERILPIAGRVIVKHGDCVRAEDVVARADLPGAVSSVNVVNQLGIAANEINQYMLKRIGDPVAQDEIIAETRPWLKWLKSVSRSPAEGVIETISEITGQVLVRHPPRPVDVHAYIDGTIVEVRENEGVVVETEGAFVQGIFGVGGEVSGELAFACAAPDELIGPERISGEMAGRVVVAGELVTSEVYRRAAQVGVAALICGGLHDRDLRDLLGYDIGVAITGHEPIRPILIMTEGFGRIAMAAATFALLKAHAGQRASANGATQIRAGVLRPEIVIPLVNRAAPEAKPEHEPSVAGLTVGAAIRIIREPSFGRIGRVKSLPAGVARIETEARVRVLEVEFESGETAVVPRANVEAIERR